MGGQPDFKPGNRRSSDGSASQVCTIVPGVAFAARGEPLPHHLGRNEPSMANRPAAALFEQFLSCRDIAEVARDILAPLARQLRCRSAFFAQIGPASKERAAILERSSFVGPIDQAVQRYAAGEFRRDPLLHAETNKVHSMSRMVRARQSTASGREHRQTLGSWYAFLRECEFGDATGITFPVNTAIGPRQILLTFHRPGGAGPFDEADARVLHDLAPALQTVLSNLVLSETSWLASQILSMLAETGALGFVLFDAAMRIRHANEPGLSALASHTAAVSNAARSNSSTRAQVLRSPGVAGETLYLSVMGKLGPGDYLERLRSEHGLTARETEVVRAIAHGHGNASAARELGIALRTVENHLRMIYAKIGIRTRTQLVARAMSAR
jgi:DNA-binding CsgD family transcriptional regulator